MLDILTKAGCYIAIIVLGMVLRAVGFFKEEDFSVLSKIVIRITLPAVIISGAAGRELDPAMLTIALLGFGGGVIYMVIGFLLNRKADKRQQAFGILNLPGYNIGNFALPFTQSFLGATGVLVTSIFDVGNAFVCLGGAFGVATAIQEGRGFDVKRVLWALSRSVPFLAYIITVSMNLLHIPIPGFVASCAGIAAGANAFLAMLMIGVGFKLDLQWEKIGRILTIIFWRYAIAAALALCYYYLLPFDLAVRQTLVILAFSPIGSAVPGFTAELKGDVGLSCSVNSLSILISIVAIVTLLAVML
jgi:predicted permease